MPENPETTVTGSTFREAMSRVAGVVHIISTGDASSVGGATATAVTSISDAPPSLLVCLNQASATLRQIRLTGVFSVNLLASDKEPLARRFSGETGIHGEARFRAEDGWILSENPPRLAEAPAVFGCRLAHATEVGSHIIVIGTVERVWLGRDQSPLLYHGRAYKSL